jgi:eukaryotic-like serine/threonine-protein kinase
LELGSHALERVAFLTFCPIYFRGEAFLAAHQPSQAAAEFQRILGHPQLTLTDPVATMATLGLARASEMSGDHLRSSALRKTLPSLWKFADLSSHP